MPEILRQSQLKQRIGAPVQMHELPDGGGVHLPLDDPRERIGARNSDIHSQAFHHVGIFRVVHPSDRARHLEMPFGQLADDEVVLVGSGHAGQCVGMGEIGRLQRIERRAVPADHLQVEKVCNALAFLVIPFNQHRFMPMLQQGGGKIEAHLSAAHHHNLHRTPPSPARRSTSSRSSS